MRIITCILILSVWLFAHKINIFLNDGEDGLVAVHAYFTKSTPCIECEVDVKSGEKILLRTKTDENGRVKFTPPSKEFSVEVNAGMGHKAQISHVVEGEFKITPKGDEELGIWAKILSVFVIFIFFAVLYMYKKRRR